MQPIHHILLFLLLLAAGSLSAQMTLHDHVHMTSHGYPNVVVQDADIDAGDADLSGQLAVWVIRNVFGPYYIDAATPLPFDRVRLEGEDTEVLLGQYITLGHELDFAGGRIDLVDQIMMLDPGAKLINESEDSYGTASNGGFFWITTFLSYPDAVDPGGFGMLITCEQELSLTQVRRGHNSLSTPGGNSIERWYQMKPAHNENVEAKVVLRYREGELNGYNAEELVVWKTMDSGQTWEMIDAVEHDLSEQMVTFAEPNSLGLYTLAPPAENQALVATPPVGDAGYGSNAFGQTRLEVYPNPVQDELQLTIESTEERALPLQLLDARGRLLRSIPIQMVEGSTQSTIPVSDLPAGTYWLRADDPAILPAAIIKQ